MREMKRKRRSFEVVAQNLIEGAVGRLLGDRWPYREVGLQLARALEDSQEAGRVANHYEVRLHPADFAAIRQQTPDLEARLARYVQTLARHAHLRPAGEIAVVASSDGNLPRHQLAIRAKHRPQVGGTTQTFVRDDDVVTAALETLDAFLIVNGRRHVPLDKPLITLGRRMDNDVIIDSPVVSRQHAHIRWRYGRFVLYDVGSRGGVSVNGESCRECVLQPGDLIMLSDRIPLIYGEGLENRNALPDTPAGDVEQETLAYPRDGGADPDVA